MNAKERKEIMLKHRQRHLESLQKLGYIYNNLNAIKMLENKAHEIATRDCNGELKENESEALMLKIETAVSRLFNGKTPKGFFINGDPRGYSLKLDPDAWRVSDDAQENYEATPIKYTDMGGYMILAPEEF